MVVVQVQVEEGEQVAAAVALVVVLLLAILADGAETCCLKRRGAIILFVPVGKNNAIVVEETGTSLKPAAAAVTKLEAHKSSELVLAPSSILQRFLQECLEFFLLILVESQSK